MYSRNKIIGLLSILTIFFNVASCSKSNISNGDFAVNEKKMEDNASTYVYNDTIILGNKNAKVTILEYSSFSCYYCIKFHKDVFPAINKEYILTGKVNFVHKDIPLDMQSLYGAVATKCLNQKNYYPAINNLFLNSDEWVYSKGDDLTKDLYKQLSSFGFEDKTEFTNCLKNKKIGQKILDERKFIIEQLQIDSTPTFFINNTKVIGYQSLSEMKKILNTELKNEEKK